MRRSDKEISDVGVIEGILLRATVCRLGLCEGDRPYVVPLCFGYQDNALYIHSAGQGKKFDILRKNNNICFEVDIDHELKTADQACGCGMKYKSVIGYGKAVFVEDIESKREALDIIMHQYLEGAFGYPEDAITNITIIKVEIESMTGKQSG
jgi:nitroimidazol reductase NimA-like FMN-containing flavoprotein (pyridoxamine 5'-phosphate oxidase superfamily)